MTPLERAEFYRLISGTRNVAGDLLEYGLKDACSMLEWTIEAGLKVPAKPIGKSQWDEAYILVMMLDRFIANLPAPTPGGDPKGFIWLTWRTREGVEFALELHADLGRQPYSWTVTKDGFKRTLSCGYGPKAGGVPFPPRPLIESLRDTFGDTSTKRANLHMVATHGD
jgi:hypothetical protein